MYEKVKLIFEDEQALNAFHIIKEYEQMQIFRDSLTVICNAREVDIDFAVNTLKAKVEYIEQ